MVSLDSLRSIQQKYSSILERKRLLHDPLYKKWQLMGNDLLPYLTKDEYDMLLQCHRIVTGRGM